MSALLRSAFSLAVLTCAVLFPASAWSDTSLSDFLPDAVFAAPDSSFGTLHYRVILPLNYNQSDTTQKYPLIIFLHGSGECLNSGGPDKQVTNDNGSLQLVNAANRPVFPCFMVYPQSATTSWTTADQKSVMAIISLLETTYGSTLDADRLYLTGLSAGGFGTYSLVNSFPKVFAAAVPMSANGGASASEVDVPFWAFHGVVDSVVGIAGDDSTVKNLRALGTHVLYTRYTNQGHVMWPVAYSEPALLPWMMAQIRNHVVAGVPILNITSPSSRNLANGGASVALSGTTEILLGGNPVSTVASTTDLVTFNTASNTTTTSTTTAWSSSVAVPSGLSRMTVLATANDATFSRGGTTTFNDSVTVSRGSSDATAPTLTLVSPSSSTTVTGSTISLTGTASDASGIVQITWSDAAGGQGTAIGTTSWTAGPITLAPGANVITVTARDGANNVVSVTITITSSSVVDATAPTIAITAPSGSGTFATTATTTALSGTAADAGGLAAVTFADDRGHSGTATGTTAWSIASLPLVVGVTVVTVTATDTSGNHSAAVITITRTADTTAPTIAITAPSSSGTFSTTATTTAVSGTAADAGGLAAVTFADDHGHSGTATGTTAWSIASVPLAVGATVVTVTATDASGNASTAVITITRTADTTAPAIAITSPSGSGTIPVTGLSVVASGTASDAGGLASVTWSNSRGGSGAATGTSTWSAIIPIFTGDNILTITATDLAGNTQTATVTVNTPTSSTVVSSSVVNSSAKGCGLGSGIAALASALLLAVRLALSGLTASVRRRH
ncbi:MAG: hypothetical protein H0X38_12055 [Planctomycetes bacterium]|nr:hypothetical protein [Planctomycetota bacterium]